MVLMKSHSYRKGILKLKALTSQVQGMLGDGIPLTVRHQLSQPKTLAIMGTSLHGTAVKYSQVNLMALQNFLASMNSQICVAGRQAQIVMTGLHQ
jgi:hypothetical protein